MNVSDFRSLIAFLIRVIWGWSLCLSPWWSRHATSPEDCSRIIQFQSLLEHDAKIINTSYHLPGTLDQAGVVNQQGFCEVHVSIPYGDTLTNELIMALWLPDKSAYRNRFLAVGNGGMAGEIDFKNMMDKLNSGRGLAIAGGNAGHRASDNHDGQGAPGMYFPYLHDNDQIRVWIHDAISTFTPTALRLIKEFYGHAPTFRYYDGCSTGGAQGMSLAQFHPELFDGIVAGCPGNWYSHLILSMLWNARQTNNPETFLSQETLNFITAKVIDACDEFDGVKDGVIENPLRCDFDLDSLLCPDDSHLPDNPQFLHDTASSHSSCLTFRQLSALTKIYSGPHRTDSSVPIYPGFSLGSEISWMQQQGRLANSFTIPLLQNLVFDNLTYDAATFDFGADVDVVDRRAGMKIDAIDANLTLFASPPSVSQDEDGHEDGHEEEDGDGDQDSTSVTNRRQRMTRRKGRRGGKMIMYQGWADPYNPALFPIQHHSLLSRRTDLHIDSWFRLFMVPGGGHCGAAQGYPGVPSRYDETLDAMIGWVEEGKAPGEITSRRRNKGERSEKKLCMWPTTASFVGDDVESADSYACR